MDRQQTKLIISVLIALFYICPLIYGYIKKRVARTADLHQRPAYKASAAKSFNSTDRTFSKSTTAVNLTSSLPGETIYVTPESEPDTEPETQATDGSVRQADTMPSASSSRREQLRNYIIWSNILERRF